MPKDPRKFLFDILERINFIFDNHISEITSLEEYEADQTIQSAVERELIIIGEAVYKLKRKGTVLVNADQIINRRNTLAHQYDVFNAAAIWVSVHNELPSLKAEVEQLLEE